jgi:hypothetical protein
MSCALLSALRSWSVPAVLLAIGLGVAGLTRGGIDPEAIEAAAARPLPMPPGATYGFRFPAPGDYLMEFMPWIRSREEFIAYFTQGEDPEVVRRYSAGPEEELIEYLGEVFSRRGYPGPRGIGRESEGRLVGRPREAEGPNAPG